MENNHFPLNRTLCQAAVILILGCLAGLLNNTFSPGGIPIAGNWKKAYGVPSPGGKHDPTYGNIEITPDRALLLLKEGALFLDARLAEGYAGGHISGARSFPEELIEERMNELCETIEPDRKVVTYCQSMECDEAHLLARALRDTGMKNVFVFAGGYEEWKAAGHPIE